MKNKLWIPIIALLLLTSVDGYGQRWKLRRYELDLWVAGVTMHADIGKANQPFANMFNGFRPSIGITPRFFLYERTAIALDLAFANYAGKDDEVSSHGRQYAFNTNAFVHGIRGEFYILGTSKKMFSGAVYNRRGMVNNYNQLYLYVFGGVSGILSKSIVKDMRNDNQEIADSEYYNNNAVYSVVFPLGVGFKLSLDPRWSIGLEMGYSFSLSDWLDGYSSPWSEYNDSYYITSVKAVYKIRSDKNGRPIFKKLYR
jgi:hypothetical protein